MIYKNFVAKKFYKNGNVEYETIQEHTDKLLKNIDILRKYYNIDEELYECLKTAAIFHDLGKISEEFQNKIINNKFYPHEIPHNFLSVAFLKNIKNNKKILDKIEEIIYAVAFHHSREINFSEQELKEKINNDLKRKTIYLNWLSNYSQYKINEIFDSYYKKLIEYQNNSSIRVKELKKSKFFILLKGFLHRIDYASSAHIFVENEKIKNFEEKLCTYLKSNLKKFQKNASKYREKSILQIASTGMGKTEFAINWIGDDKAFYVLPLKVSVNAMYERFCKIFGSNSIGLLHGESIFYKIDKNDEIEIHINNIKLSRQLSMPITITTADQIFTAVFKYAGYEKIYATMSYSKIVLDEPQSYSPETIAVIIKGLKEISELGGKFCFMSATIHPFIISQLEHYCKILPHVFNKEEKHKIKFIDDDFNLIENLYKKGKKILIIVNTVKKAQSLYKKLNYIGNVKLLHSLFIWKDRYKKEKEILNDFKQSTPVIWITTQIVEASLDIDYDVLFTEIASFDSLTQRMGRIYRRKGRKISKNCEPNIFIFSQSPSDNGYIYDKEIVAITKDELLKFDGNILKENDKQNLMNEIYNESKIKNTKFYEKFKNYTNILELGFEAENKNEAEKLFRKIFNVSVIPFEIYKKNFNLLEQLIAISLDYSKPAIERIKALKEINSFTLSVPVYRIKEFSPALISNRLKNQIFTINAEYNSEIGLTFKQKEFDNFI